MKKITEPAYEQRLILFIDFLGFKETVAETANDPRALRRLIAALNEIREVGSNALHGSQQVTQFSDSVVVSFRVNERSGVFWLLQSIGITVVSLAGRGYLLRGAVTIGDLYHDDRHVIGPAMVKAYEMESKVAKYPRVIVDPAVLAIARQNRSRIHSPDEEEGHVRKFLVRDMDDQLYFDWISWRSVIEVVGGDNDRYPDYLRQLSRVLEGGLQHSDPRVAEKHLWVHRHYVQALDTFAVIPPDHGYRLENPGLCEAVVALPRFELLARDARRRVDESSAAGGTPSRPVRVKGTSSGRKRSRPKS